jgi:hypothetical protein
MTGFLGIILQLAGLVPSIIILIGCCIIFGRMRNEGAVLMLVGKALGLFVSIVWVTFRLVSTAWMIRNNALGMMAFVLPFVSISASFIFAFGFIRIAGKIEAEE